MSRMSGAGLPKDEAEQIYLSNHPSGCPAEGNAELFEQVGGGYRGGEAAESGGAGRSFLASVWGGIVRAATAAGEFFYGRSGEPAEAASGRKGGSAKFGGDNAAAQRGRAVHAALKQVVQQKGGGWQSEPRVFDPSTGHYVQPDILTPSGSPIELKPRTPSGAKAGQAQLRLYEAITGKKGRVIFYDP